MITKLTSPTHHACKGLSWTHALGSPTQSRCSWKSIHLCTGASRAGCYIPMSPLVPLSGIFWFRRMQERSKYLLHRDGCFQLQISDAHQARFSTNCAVINGNLQTNHHYNSHPPLSNQPFFYRMPFLRSRFSSFCFSGYRLPKLSWVCASSPLNEMPRTSSKPAGISPHRVGSFPPS